MIAKCRVCWKYTRLIDGLCKYCKKKKSNIDFSADRMSDSEGVYVIHAVGTGYYKIGRTGNLYSRFAHLKSDFPVELRIIAFHETEQSRELESGLHHIHKGFRGGRTEWFKLDAQQVRSLTNSSTKVLLEKVFKTSKILENDKFDEQRQR